MNVRAGFGVQRGSLALFVALTFIGVVVPGGVTYAWFSAGGSGVGSATAGMMDDVTIASEFAVPVTALLPGHTGDIALKINNPNGFNVNLVSVVRDGTRPIVVSNASGCTPENAGLTFTDQSGLAITIAATTAGQYVTLPAAIAMAVSAANECQGAQFGIPVTITVRSS